MRIALVSTDNSKVIQIGGKHVHQNLLERGLIQLGHAVETFYPEPATKVKIIKFLALRPWKAFGSHVDFIKYKSLIGYYFDFFKKCDFHSFNVVHVHDVVATSAIRTNCKLVLTVHGYCAKEALNYGKFYTIAGRRKAFDYYMTIEEEAYSKASHIIAVDTRIRDYLVDAFSVPFEKITVMYNAIDTDKFTPIGEGEKEDIRRELGLPSEKLIVFVPRRYVNKNGVHYAARAFNKLDDKDFFFVFAGRGPLKSLVGEILRGKENAMIMDGIPYSEVHKYYQASDIILIPSITTEEGVEEATSLSMLEGMACGKIVVCTNVGGMKEVVKDGENGFLIEQKSEDAIIEKLLFIKENICILENLRRRARKCVVQNHGYIQHTKKVLGVYMKVLNGT